MPEDQFTIDIRQESGFAFRVDFGLEGIPELLLDEPAPLGSSRGPNPSRVLAAAVGTCLSASLLFCLQKTRVDIRGIQARVRTDMTRNSQGRLRIGGIRIEIEVDPTDGSEKGLERCRRLFREYCVVTESVQSGIPVEVEVRSKGG